MSTLTINKSYADLTVLLEVDIDAFRDGLLTLFNTTKFDAADFPGGVTLTSVHLSSNELTSADNTYITFGDSDDGLLGLDASKNLVFDTTSGNTLTFKAVDYTTVFKTTQVDVPGDILVGNGTTSYGILHLISKYRKPVIEYYGTTSISIENNTSTTNETLLVLPTYILAVTEALSGSSKYRSMSLSSTANGYNASHTGAALGGKRSGVTLTDNNWYYIYAARVRYGTNAGNNFIMVADTLAPTQANESALDGHYGTGQWVYLGVIRYGYGAVGSASSIIPFLYTNKGWCYFTSNDSGTANGGVVLVSSTTDADDTPIYTVASGTGNAQIPLDVITHGQFNMYRTRVSDWAIRDTADTVVWRGGWQTFDTSMKHGYLVEVAIYADMDFTQTRKGTGAVTKRVVLTSFCDKYVNTRRHGHGV